jgi:hypothetical protein
MRVILLSTVILRQTTIGSSWAVSLGEVRASFFLLIQLQKVDDLRLLKPPLNTELSVHI